MTDFVRKSRRVRPYHPSLFLSLIVVTVHAHTFTATRHGGTPNYAGTNSVHGVFVSSVSTIQYTIAGKVCECDETRRAEMHREPFGLCSKNTRIPFRLPCCNRYRASSSVMYSSSRYVYTSTTAPWSSRNVHATLSGSSRAHFARTSTIDSIFYPSIPLPRTQFSPSYGDGGVHSEATTLTESIGHSGDKQ